MNRINQGPMNWRKGIFFTMLFGIRTLAISQDHPGGFVYIQSDQGRLFYVKTEGRIFSASEPGYIILSGLQAGRNRLVIGFPRNEFPEQLFLLPKLGEQDQGYLLKHDQGDRFVLYSLLNFRRIEPDSVSRGISFGYQAYEPMAQNSPSGPSDTSRKRRLKVVHHGPIKDTTPQNQAREISRFRQLLDEASREGRPIQQTFSSQTMDSLRKPRQFSGQKEPGGDSSRLVLARASGYQDTLRSAPDLQGNNPGKTPSDSAGNQSPGRLPDGRISPLASASGNQNPDSIRATTPVRETYAGNRPVSELHPGSQPHFIHFAGDSASGLSSSSMKPNPFLGDSLTVVTKQPSLSEKGQQEPGNSKTRSLVRVLKANQGPVMINSDCRSLADEQTFQKLRRRMAVQDNDENMVRIAEKFFRQDCYSVDQVRQLAYLISSDEYRLRLVSLAYAHVYDTDHFGNLSGIFGSPAYKNRFLALIRP